MEFMQYFENLPIHFFDLGVVLVLLISALLAYFRGFVLEVLAVTGWIMAGLATFHGLPIFRPYAETLVTTEAKSSTLSLAIDLGLGIVIFVLSLTLISFFTRGISKTVQRSILQSLDRALGFLFGLARGGVLVCLLYLGVDLVFGTGNKPNWLASAKSLDLIIPGAAAIQELIPEAEDPSSISITSQKARDSSKKILNAKEAMELLITPRPQSGKKNNEGSYGLKERNEMERLIDAKRAPKSSKN